MPLPELTQKRVESILKAFCEERFPAHTRDQIRLGFEIRGNNVTLFEERPDLSSTLRLSILPRGKSELRTTAQAASSKTAAWSKMPIAQFRFDPKSKTWQLYCKFRDERWHEYIETVPTRSFMELLTEVDQDPTGIFWG